MPILPSHSPQVMPPLTDVSGRLPRVPFEKPHRSESVTPSASVAAVTPHAGRAYARTVELDHLPSFLLNGQIAVVTGASRGIGPRPE